MSSTFFGLNIGKSGLYAYQIGINTTAHNISNSETTGYTRQLINQQASKALSVGSSYGMVGTGVEVTSIEQVRSQYLDEKYRFNSGLSGNYSTKSYYMQEIQSYLNEVSLEGFTTNFDDFYDTLQELSKDGSGTSQRTQVTQYASTLTEYMNELSSNLQSVQSACNSEIKNEVDRINSIAEQLTVLNSQIITVEATGETANDLRDQRNNLIDELSTYGSVTVTENSVGDAAGVSTYVVKLNGQTLVSTMKANTLTVVSRTDKVNQTDVDGLYDIQWSDGRDFNVTGSDCSGSLKALIEIRDGNNGTSFSGTANGTEGSNTLTLTDTSVNAIAKLNISESGTITIGNTEYSYSSFDLSTDDDGNYVYTFTLDDELSSDVTDATASIGDSINYKGIPYYMSQLTEFVRTYAQNYNDICKTGVDANGDAGVDFFTATDITTGDDITFDSELDYYKMTAGNMSVNSTILADCDKVVTYSNTSDGVANTDVLTQLIALKSDTTMFKQGTPSSFFQTTVAEVGVNTESAMDLAENQEDIIDSIENQKLSVSGVDLDEEAMNLIKYQNAYNLAAKVVSVMDEIYDRLINYMAT